MKTDSKNKSSFADILSRWLILNSASVWNLNLKTSYIMVYGFTITLLRYVEL